MVPRARGAASTAAGFPVVLTADRTLVAGYRTLFDGMLSASQTTTTPGLLMRCLLAPPVASDALRVRQAPLGARRVEAALVRDGWPAEDVAIVRPRDLAAAVGPATRVIGLSGGEPLGLGMNSNTMVDIAGGEIYPSRWFRRLAGRVARVRRRAAKARVVLGGAGAWQLRDAAARRALGIDHVVLGYCEGNVASVFRRIAHGEALPEVIEGQAAPADAIPSVLGPTVMGAVEVSRGCGLGCHFCTIGRPAMVHLPPDTILADVETNVAAGVGAVALVTEDLFRYGGKGFQVRPEALVELLARIRRVPGIRLIQTDHANITSVAAYADDALREIARLFVPEGQRHDFIWLNLGIESASGELLSANGGRAKMGSIPPQDWGDACLEQVQRLIRAGFFPFVSLLMGMPGEEPEHVEETIAWVDRLRGERVAVFPLFYAPIDGQGRPFGVADMTPAHWRLFRLSYALNFRWLPKLCWDNQAAAGVPLWKRSLLQMMGRGQVVMWQALFAWRSGRVFA